ncbi:MAG: O-acetyl-ADP-ribose deacetylase [Magnetococcales bacterium]|nr:O-acetyl-ADP-ribose deacetylase [Magnetococcales bacterium]
MQPPTIDIRTGDITQLHVDAIVNAANSSLMGGGGVDGAIHRAAGPALKAACQKIRETSYPDGLPTGEVVITPGGNLPALHVIHTVGPVYHHEPQPALKLAACYRNALNLARETQLSTIAFPGISTGVYGYPKEEAAQVAAQEINAFRKSGSGSLKQVVLIAFSEGDAAILRQAFGDTG